MFEHNRRRREQALKRSISAKLLRGTCREMVRDRNHKGKKTEPSRGGVSSNVQASAQTAYDPYMRVWAHLMDIF